jgi:anti-sigma factor RsiW
VTNPVEQRHLELSEVVGYVARTLPAGDRDRVERHLADCSQCANEIGDMVLIRGPAEPRRRGFQFVALTAAAAALLLVVWSRQPERPAVTRELPLTSTLAPRPLPPMLAGGRTTLHWIGVPGAGRYRVLLFDSLGSSLLESTSPETLLAVPDSVPLVPGRLYLWKVEAEATPDHWTSSELTELRGSRARAP